MMNRIVIIFLIFTTTVSAGQADSVFVKANKLYQQEKYNEALTLYAEIEGNKIQSDGLFYNMANAYYKLNKIAPAIYYYEKALLLNPGNADAKFNLGFAKRMAIDNIEPLPQTFSQKISEGLIQRLTYNNWAWLGVILAFLFAILFLLYHFTYNSGSKRLYFISSLVCAFLALIMISFAYQNYKTVGENRYAIIFAQQSDIKNAPTLSSEVSFELHEGTKVQILESLDNWKKIKIADGKIGWIVADEIKEL